MQSSAINWFRSVPRSVRIAVPVAAIALGAAACGSAAASNNATATTHHPPSAAPSAAGVTLQTHQGPAGTYLTDASGRSVYLWHADKGMSSNCVGSCAVAWPPLTTTGSVAAGSGVQASDIGTIT